MMVSQPTSTPQSPWRPCSWGAIRSWLSGKSGHGAEPRAARPQGQPHDHDPGARPGDPGRGQRPPGFRAADHVVHRDVLMGNSLDMIPQMFVGGIQSFVLLAVPLFMLAGGLMNEAGVTDRLFRFTRALVGHIAVAWRTSMSSPI